MSIGILSFNRPHYLASVLKSLRKQITRHDEVVLFQDGAVNRFSGRTKASQGDIRSCVDMFKVMIPWGTVIEAKQNLGIALNYHRAETYFFSERCVPHAVLLEDDLVLSRNYLAVIRMLLKLALSDRRIAYVSAYGNMWASLIQQRSQLKDLQHMHENWGFARTRESWLEEAPFRSQYLALLQDKDYSERDHSAISAFYQRRGWKTHVTSQDAARWVASVELGKIRLTTFACHAHYIGAEGEHFSPAAYYNSGFQHTQMYKGRLAELAVLSSDTIESWLATERKRFRGEIDPSFYPGHGGV